MSRIKKKFEQVFILGAPRSGTTFLAELMADSRFGAPVESHFITKIYKRIEAYGDLSKGSNLKTLMADILRERAVAQWGLDIDVDEFYESLQNDFSYSNIVNELMTKRASGGRSGCWGDKTPHYIGDVDLLLEIFPDAKFINIVRDGRDVSLSILKKEWGPNNIYECAKYWKHLNRHKATLKMLEEKGLLFFLRYEDLLLDVEVFAGKIYEFIGDDLDHNKRKSFANSVNRYNYNKWKSTMSSKDLRVFESIAGDELSFWGYPLSSLNPHVSRAEILYYTIHSKVKRILFLFKTNVIDGLRIRFFGKEPFAD